MSGTTWSKAETLKLIAIWGEERIQKKLQECKKNKSIYEEIAREMRDSGYDRSYQQCRDKIKKLKGDYKKEKDRHGNTGEGRRTWEYFDAMDAILGHRPTTRPPVVIDSLDADSAVLSTQNNTQDEEDEEPEDVGEKNDEPESPSSLNSSNTSLPLKGDSGKQDRKRKKPPNKAEAVIDLLGQVMSAQHKSDERMMEIEEKRLKMEERQMEREAVQRREEREFQMQMTRMMMMGPGMHPLPPPPPPSHHRMHNDPSSSSGSFEFNFGTEGYHSFARPFEDDQ